MKRLTNQAIADLLHALSRQSSGSGDNRYRAKTYARAAETVAGLNVPLSRIIAEGRLESLPGIGSSIADIITQLHRTGTHPTIAALRDAAPHKVAAGQSGESRCHIHRAAAILESTAAEMREAYPEFKRITFAGDFRRGLELVSDLALVVETTARKNGPQLLQSGEGLEVHLTDKRHYGITLLLATGSTRHVEALQALAREKGWILDQRGLRNERRTIAADREERIYEALDLPFIPPELREGRGEIARAIAEGPPRLVTESDIRGVLHAHTDRSDGTASLEAMAGTARDRGYQYFGVTDHSQSAHYAHGLSVARIGAQHREIDKLNKSFGRSFRILKGIEADIMADGSLDYPDAVLARFDFVVASVHSRFNLDSKAQTDRILSAVENPFTSILGHMTGRQLLRRPGYKIDVEAVLKACAARGVAVEINGNPWRLDLDWRWHQRALALGCIFSINPDAHSIAELDLTRWGVTMARKGEIPPERVLNCLSLQALDRHLRRRRALAGQ